MGTTVLPSILLVPADSPPVTAAISTMAAATPAAPPSGELSDDDLEHVVGGLARSFIPSATPRDTGIDAITSL